MEGQNLNKSTHQSEEKKPNAFLSVFGWIFGLFLIVWGFSAIGTQSFIAVAAAFVVGIAFLPPLSKKMGMNIWIKAGGVIVWFVILATTMPTVVDETASTADVATAKKMAVKSPEDIFKEQLAKGYCDSINANKDVPPSREDMGINDAFTLGQLDEKGKPHGLAVSFAGGRMTCVECYKHGNKHGIWRGFKEDGGRLESHYLDGKTNGLDIQWHSNGQKNVQVPYVNGKMHGVKRIWYEDGQLCAEVPYKNGQIHGVEKRWHENGVHSFEMEYINGKEEGVGTRWDKDGNVGMKRKYKNGKYIGPGF